MKKIIALLIMITPLIVFAQSVAINTDGTSPNNSSILDIKSNSKGLLVPRMTTVQRIAIPSPAVGLTVFDTDTYSYWMYRGFIQGGWAEMQHNFQNYWDVSGFDISNKNNGNVGIGISNPAAKFHVVNGAEAALNTNGYLMLGSQTGTNLILDNNEIMARFNGNATNLYLQNGSGNVYIGDPSDFNSAHKLGVDGNTVITGALRIGTTVTPSGYKLAVDGKVICTELMVRLVPNWPDYVFNTSYKLRSLQEVEDFIKKNNHLPGIPSAKNIETSGLNVGEMQKLQMEKIEELTLYIIELKKEIEVLKDRKNVGNTKAQRHKDPKN